MAKWKIKNILWVLLRAPVIYGAHTAGILCHNCSYSIIFIYVYFHIKKLLTLVFHETFSFSPKNNSFRCYIQFLYHTGYLILPLSFLLISLMICALLRRWFSGFINFSAAEVISGTSRACNQHIIYIYFTNWSSVLVPLCSQLGSRFL